MTDHAVFWTDELLDELSAQGDRDASVDAMIAAYFDGGDVSQAEVLRHLGGQLHGDEEAIDPAIKAYLDDRPPYPAWVDLDAVRRAEVLFARVGPALGWSLMTLGFPAGYAGARGTRVLATTGDLAMHTKRRVLETAQLVVDAMQVGGLEVGAAGWMAARRVRLMHGGVRHMIADSRHHEGLVMWDDTWGVPLNQEQLIGFIMPMTLTAFAGIDACGLRLTDAEQRDYLHAWCVIGWLHGVREDLLPLTLESAIELWAAVRRRNYERSPEGVELTAHLIDMLRDILPPGLGGLPATFMRHVLGAEVCDLLDVPKANWTRVLLGPIHDLGEEVQSAELRGRLAARVLPAISRRAIRGWLELERHGKPVDFAIPDHLVSDWHLKTTPLKRRRVTRSSAR